MNQGTVTGGVVEAATSAYTPATKDTASQRKVVFAIMVSDSHHGKHLWKCEAEGAPDFLDDIEREAVPGRGIKLEFELAARPFMQHGIRKGESRFLRVIRAEFAVKKEAAPEPVEAAG